MPSKSLQEAKEALEELDADRLLSAYAEEFLFEDTSAGVQIMDEPGLRSYFQQLFSSPGVAFSGVHIFDGGNFAVIEWIWSGVKHATRESFRVKGASILELLEGKIVRESIYYDPRPALS